MLLLLLLLLLLLHGCSYLKQRMYVLVQAKMHVGCLMAAAAGADAGAERVCVALMHFKQRDCWQVGTVDAGKSASMPDSAAADAARH